MFISRPTRKGTGIAFYGKEADLKSLHEIVHYLAEDSDPDNKLSKGKNLLLMNFAYEVRKAFSGMRLAGSAKDPELFGLLGFSIVWTDILLFTNALRQAAGRRATDEPLLKHLDSLESAVHKGIQSYDGKMGDMLSRYVGMRIPTEDEFIFQIYQALHIEFVSMTFGGKSRFRKIPSILEDYFSLFSPIRIKLIGQLTLLAFESNCDPADLGFEDFPEIVW